jgi:hypothetical protein
MFAAISDLVRALSFAAVAIAIGGGLLILSYCAAYLVLRYALGIDLPDPTDLLGDAWRAASPF